MCLHLFQHALLIKEITPKYRRRSMAEKPTNVSVGAPIHAFDTSHASGVSFASLSLIHIYLQHMGREEVDLKLWVDSLGTIAHSELSGIGGPQFLNILEKWRPKLVGKLSELGVPKGRCPGSMLIREAILKACGRWNFPVESEYLCHCRGIKTSIVDRAVITGAHRAEEVSSQTSAGTGCGTCWEDIKSVIAYRLGGSKAKAKTKAS